MNHFYRSLIRHFVFDDFLARSSEKAERATPRHFQAANKNLTKFLIGFLLCVSLLLLHRHGTTFSYCPQTQRKSFSFEYKCEETTKANKNGDT